MIMLVIIACLGGSCHKYEVAASATMTACVYSSPMLAAQWAGTHPNHKIKTMRCEVGRET